MYGYDTGGRTSVYGSVVFEISYGIKGANKDIRAGNVVESNVCTKTTTRCGWSKEEYPVSL